MSKRMRRQLPTAEMFQLEENSSLPIWLQLKNRFIYLITSGIYMPGEQLPTVRSLAADIEINYNTVSKVYKSLEEDGYIVSRHRQGVFVCDVSDKQGVSLAVTAKMITVEYIQRCQKLGLSLGEISTLFNESMMEMKIKRNKEQGGTNGSAEQGEEGPHIICFPDTKDEPAKHSTGNRA